MFCSLSRLIKQDQFYLSYLLLSLTLLACDSPKSEPRTMAVELLPPSWPSEAQL